MFSGNKTECRCGVSCVGELFIKDGSELMKEFLNKKPDGSYELIVSNGGCVDRDWIEIPEGAEVATKNGGTIFFWKPSQNSTYVDDEGWVLTIKGMISFEEYSRNPHCRIVWEKNIGVLRIDNVDHPSHYTQGKIECIDALESATIGKSGIEAVCVANVIKYLWRYEEKNGLEDVKKAQWYLERLVASMGS